jgi:hypothetical protein
MACMGPTRATLPFCRLSPPGRLQIVFGSDRPVRLGEMSTSNLQRRVAPSNEYDRLLRIRRNGFKDTSNPNSQSLGHFVTSLLIDTDRRLNRHMSERLNVPLFNAIK